MPLSISHRSQIETTQNCVMEQRIAVVSDRANISYETDAMKRLYEHGLIPLGY